MGAELHLDDVAAGQPLAMRELAELRAERDGLRDSLALASEDEMGRQQTERYLQFAIEERDAIKLQAQIHAQEARTANSTIADIYQLCSGGKGEPGNWNGAEPVRVVVAERDSLHHALDHFIAAAALYHTCPHDPVAIRGYAKARGDAVDLIGGG